MNFSKRRLLAMAVETLQRLLAEWEVLKLLLEALVCRLLLLERQLL
ncbi:unnamed protein product [Meloidogyne enterolobii]|uniref:Uncharacterized protein n=1 Tax=Meloidogyne enterolobii TaxID=390850 RepID=A0ACB0ZY64_MELEN